ncbi:AMP-binding protein [Alteromonas sp. AMM-1]|uniref:AMP-binding protein n=1 Tax=Alteromonas sp. AMM-1 TaxID=3394233 RepID=UPI0039A4B5B3
MNKHQQTAIPFIGAHQHSAKTALFDDEQSVSYRTLTEMVNQRRQTWLSMQLPPRAVVVLIIDNSIAGVVDYLSALSLDWVVLLLNPACDDLILQRYCDALRPHAVIRDGALTLRHSDEIAVDCNLSILLSTSGSTGAGKCVALSQRNLLANAESILAFLPIESDDITLATMPLSYSYGLSVLHTHLLRGASIGFTRYTVFDKAFWEKVKTLPVHSLAGVPSFYEMLLRLRFTRMELPALRYFTQAGGRLASTDVTTLGEYARTNHKQFFVMYGQTEATARMAFLDPQKVLKKPDSIGQAIPGGRLEIRMQNNDAGELYYKGQNVMLGYVECTEQLAELNPEDWLATGDLARQDEEGDFFIVGRIKRIIKVAGERVNLDALEQFYSDDAMQVRCVGEDNKVVFFALQKHLGALQEKMATHPLLPARNQMVSGLGEWPLLSNGKPDYQQLANRVLGPQ